MKKVLLRARPVAFLPALMTLLPTIASAHDGLDRGSAMMQRLHTLAHTLSDHPLIVIILAGALLGACGLYKRASGSHRQSD